MLNTSIWSGGGGCVIGKDLIDFFFILVGDKSDKWLVNQCDKVVVVKPMCVLFREMLSK